MTKLTVIDQGLEDVTLIQYLKEKNSILLPTILDVYGIVKELLNTRIPQIFPNYTLHNTGHSFRIMEYMSKVIPDYKSLNDLEIALLIYAALLHDIGMAVSKDNIELIKRDAFPHSEIKFSAMKKYVNGDEIIAIQEYVRRIHGKMSAYFILENLKDKLTVPNFPTLNFAEELALICQSHTEDFDWLKRNLQPYEVKGNYHFNSQFIASILRIGDILDIDSNRTPYNLYKLIAPPEKSDEEWKQHFIISNNEKIVLDDNTGLKKIVFHGKATNPSIHRKLLIYIDWVKDELVNTIALTNLMHAQYKLNFENNPVVNIQTEGYTFSDYKMTLEFKAISSLLMGEKIYGDKTLGLRELIQNSIDACRLRQEIELESYEFGEDIYEPKIKVIIDKVKNEIIIKDNGIGMSNNILKKHFLNIGVSYYNSTDFLLKDYNYKPIGNFGIGFLSCFMLSEQVTVITRYYKSRYKYTIELERGNEYTSFTESEDVTFDGTEVILNYDIFMANFMDDLEKVENFLKKYFLTDGIKFELIKKVEKDTLLIENYIKYDQTLDRGLIKINLADYLNEIEGYALVRPRNAFIKNWRDLDFDGTLYYYDEERDDIIEVSTDTQIAIDDIVLNREISYLAIPLIEFKNEEDFLNGMKFTDGDVEAVLDKMSNDIEWISILFHKAYQPFLSENIIDSDSYFFENLGLEDLISLGHSDSCITKSYLKKIRLYEGEKNTLYLPFDIKTSFYHALFGRSGIDHNYLYIRSVLIRDYNIVLPIQAEIFYVNKLVVNVNSRKFIPDISRNNLDIDTGLNLNNIIGKAIHKGVLSKIKLNRNEKEVLANFVNTFYTEKTEFEK